MSDQNDLQTTPKAVNQVQAAKPHFLVNSQSFGYRLRNERERLGFTQTALGKLAGIGRTTQHVYETDVRSPDVAYLEKMQGSGVDVAYLLLGVRRKAIGADSVSLSYSALANIYRIVDEYCVDPQGQPLPLEVRVQFFKLLCVTVKDKDDQGQSLDSLRQDLQQLLGQPAAQG